MRSSPVPTTPRNRLEDLLGRPDHEVDLAEAALLIAAQEYEDLDVRAYQVRLDEMGRGLRARLEDEQRPERAVMALNHYLFQELGFRGNSEQYYDARNSYLNEVIDRRTGIPITLSLVYIEVGRRAGLEVRGRRAARALRGARADSGARAARGSVPRRHAAEREGLPAAARPHLRRQGQARAEDAAALRPQGHGRARAAEPEGDPPARRGQAAGAARGRPAGARCSPAAPRTCATAACSTPHSTATASRRTISSPTWRSPPGRRTPRSSRRAWRSSSSRPHGSTDGRKAIHDDGQYG